MSDPVFNDFSPFDNYIEDMTRRMEPAQRKALSMRIATDLRAANARRERANEQPDGSPMEKRKARAGGKARTRRLRDTVTRLRRQLKGGKMFLRAAAPRYLRKKSSAGEAQVGFVGAMARIMRVHQLGLRDTVTRDPASPEVTYPARVVLGMNSDDRAKILEHVADHLAI